MEIIKMFFLISFKILHLMIMLIQMPNNFLIVPDLLHENNMGIFILSQNFVFILQLYEELIIFILREFVIKLIVTITLSIL